MQQFITQAERRTADPTTETASIAIVRYVTQAPSTRNPIKLRQNLLSFLLEGEKTVYYAGTTVRLKPGQFLLLSAGNCIMSEKMGAEEGSYKSLLISFDNKLLADFFVRYSRVLQTPAGQLRKEPFLLFDRDVFLDNYVTSLNQLLIAGQPLSPGMQLIKLEELLLYLGETYPGQLQKLRQVSQEADDDVLVRQAVTAHMDQPITVEELAFLCHTSLSTFKRRFSKIYGSSPTKWLLEKRMQKAARLLKQDQYMASEIYYELGYENLSSFIQSFKQVYGVTPKQYQVAP